MAYRKIKLSIEQGIAFIELNSPENFNAITAELSRELIEALEQCNTDHGVRVVILSAAGKAFCAGGDLKAFGEHLAGDAKTDTTIEIGGDIRLVSNVARLIRRLRVPVICAIHGSAAGAGMNLALMCDFKIAAEDAKFIAAFVNIALVPDMGGTYVLSKHVGMAKLNEALMLGEPISAQEALDLGMVNQVVPKDELENAALTLAKKLISKPALALEKIKRLVNLSLFDGLDTVLEAEEEYQVLCAGSPDFREGVTAFFEKRKPVYNAQFGKES